jgi:hypothetical protein
VELVHVELAQEDESGLAQLGYNGGVIGGDVALEDARGTGGLHTLDAEDVFETYRHPLPGAAVAFRLGVHRAGGAERARLIHRQVGLDLTVH